MILLNYIILIICVLISVAFGTLLEGKILGYIQIRKGPNKVQRMHENSLLMNSLYQHCLISSFAIYLLFLAYLLHLLLD